MRANPSSGTVERDVTPESASESPGPRPQTAGRLAALAFSALLFIPVESLFESHPSPIRLALVLADFVAFFVIYVVRLVFAPMTPRPPRSMVMWIGAALALAVVLVVGDDAHRWAPLFIFVSAVVGVRVGLPWAAYGIAACTIVAALVLLPTAPVDDTLAIALQALAVGALTVGMGRLRATVLELQEAREQLARLAVTEERLRFARDLHDLLGHTLSVIALKADLAGRLLPAWVDRAAEEVADIDAVARSALAEVREAVSGYRQPTLGEAVATGRLALDAAGIEGTWEIAQVALPPVIDVVLAWAVREAVTNVIRHSRAHRCWVRITAGLVEAAAEVIDDGVGHAEGDGGGPPPSVAGDQLPPWAGNGLTGLAERVAALGGRLQVAPRGEGGFRLRASVPTATALAGPQP